MHSIFDGELVLLWHDNTSNMGKDYYPSVATLLGGDPLEKEWATTGHTTPGFRPVFDAHLVTGDGGTC